MGREGWLRKKKLTECLLLATPLHCLIDLGWVNAKSASCKTLCKHYLIECVAMLESYLYFMLINFLLVLFYSKHFKNTTTNRGYNWGGGGHDDSSADAFEVFVLIMHQRACEWAAFRL